MRLARQVPVTIEPQRFFLDALLTTAERRSARDQCSESIVEYLAQ